MDLGGRRQVARAIAVDPKRRGDAELAERLVEELRAALPGKRTLIEQELERSLRMASSSERLAVGRQTHTESLHGGDTAVPSSAMAGLASAPVDELRRRGLRDILAALAAMPGRRGLMQAASATASRAMRAEVASQTGRPAPPDPGGQAMWLAAERRGATLYRRATAGVARPADPAVEDALRRIGSGQVLAAEVRRAMERELGIPLDSVRIHTDGVAANAARAVCAEAFTVGEDIFFAEHAFAPDTERGARLLVHELTHVIQARQQRTSTADQSPRISEPGEHLEREADAAAERLGDLRAALHPPGAAPEDRGGDVHAAAALGISGRPGVLPFFDVIQPLFGPHDLRGVRAHLGTAARAGAERMGASAFTSGEDIAFATEPTLELVAHEAAHVVQQRAGIQLASGVGEAGDPYERHADAVAAHVVAGISAAPILDSFAGNGNSARPTVQQAKVIAPGQPNSDMVYGGKSSPDSLRPNGNVNQIADDLLEKLKQFEPGDAAYMIGVAECDDGSFIVAESGNDTGGFTKAVEAIKEQHGPRIQIAPAIKKAKNVKQREDQYELRVKGFDGRRFTYSAEANQKTWGVCAAPKILHHALMDQSRIPIALVEKWFTNEAHSRGYAHGATIGPCDEHCVKLLPTLLGGRQAALNKLAEDKRTRDNQRADANNAKAGRLRAQRRELLLRLQQQLKARAVSAEDVAQLSSLLIAGKGVKALEKKVDEARNLLQRCESEDNLPEAVKSIIVRLGGKASTSTSAPSTSLGPSSSGSPGSELDDGSDRAASKKKGGEEETEEEEETEGEEKETEEEEGAALKPGETRKGKEIAGKRKVRATPVKQKSPRAGGGRKRKKKRNQAERGGASGMLAMLRPVAPALIALLVIMAVLYFLLYG